MAKAMPELFQILSDEMRWNIIQQLTMSDLKVSELAARLNAGHNKLSYHLAVLRDAGLVREKRSNADGRDVYYHLKVDVLADAYQLAGKALHPAIFEQHDPEKPAVGRLYNPVRMLFLCTHNSARSQMAEGLARHLGAGLIESYSAGTEATFIKPEAIEVMKRRGIDISGQKSEILTEYLDQPFDYVITVCDSARESCPVFPGGDHSLHWSFDDPSEVQGEGRLPAFEATARQIATRITYLITIISKQQGVPNPMHN